MPLSRSGWSLTCLASVSVVLIAPDTASLLSEVGSSDFPRTLVAVASLAQLCVAGWVLLIIAAATVPGASHVVRHVTPELLWGALFAGAVGALTLSPAHADRGSSPAHATPQEHSLQGLRLPDRPAVAGPTQRAVLVRPGDTLWAIAARSLPADATDAEIASACARWYAANRSTIGRDPDLIHPEQRLLSPAEDPTTKDVP